MLPMTGALERWEERGYLAQLYVVLECYLQMKYHCSLCLDVQRRFVLCERRGLTFCLSLDIVEQSLQRIKYPFQVLTIRDSSCLSSYNERNSWSSEESYSCHSDEQWNISVLRCTI